MVDIDSIRVNLQTRRVDGGGTDGDVYLGFGGREFSLDTSADDFESGSSRGYVLGAGANVRHASTNDPRNPQLRLEDSDRFPVYVRFQPRGREDNWSLARAVVTVNDQLFPQWDSAETVPFRVGIWLGTHSGLVLHLAQHDEGPVIL